MSPSLNRRTFLQAAGSALLAGKYAYAAAGSLAQPTYTTTNRRWQQGYDRALDVLRANVQVLPHIDLPVLIEGADYAGVWQECGPHESLVYRHVRPDVARNTHMTFFQLQRPDGQLPANNKRSETGFGQIQMVVPIAATAHELAAATGDSELLEAAYRACSRWDDWLMRYRNTRGTGLIEGFCTYDTGHDNSPRWAGMPRQCPDKDARRCPPDASLPRLCPDLSATVYGGRIALAAMAQKLGKPDDSARWLEQADALRTRILDKLYVPEDAAFYDLDAKNNFIRVRSDILSRMCGEHIPDQKLFDELWTRQLGKPAAFWAPFPLPSIALDDPTFVRPIPRNSWGGAAQALTALRAGRWFDHYGRSAEFSRMMDAWCEALLRDMTFRQQMDPLDGGFTQADKPSYSPAALVLLDYTWRLAGVRPAGDTLEWNVRPEHPAAERAHFALPLAGATAEITYRKAGQHPGSADLRLAGRLIARVEGTARLTTDRAGKPLSLLGIDSQVQQVTLHLDGPARGASAPDGSAPDGSAPAGRPGVRRMTLAPNQRVAL